MSVAGLEIPSLSESDLARFWSKVAVAGPNDCWTWTAAQVHAGYGALKVRRPWKVYMIRAHRISYRLAHPDDEMAGLEVCHSCDNPPCVNPAHLFLGTPLVNAIDRDTKGRGIRGTRCHAAKVTDKDVLEIRSLANVRTTAELMAIYGLNRSSVRKIILGNTWAHVRG